MGGQVFMGLQVPVQVGQELNQPKTYELQFTQELSSIYEGLKTWRFSCEACRVAGGTRVVRWQSSPFVTGTGEVGEEEQKQQYAQVLEEVREHAMMHERIARWYEQLAESPARHAGWVEGMADAGRQVQ